MFSGSLVAFYPSARRRSGQLTQLYSMFGGSVVTGWSAHHLSGQLLYRMFGSNLVTC
jgi:hypothetical protein